MQRLHIFESDEHPFVENIQHNVEAPVKIFGKTRGGGERAPLQVELVVD